MNHTEIVLELAKVINRFPDAEIPRNSLTVTKDFVSMVNNL